MAKMITKDLVSVALIVALLVVCDLSLSVGHGHVANSESEADIASRQEFLDAHNEARAQVGVGPFRWSALLAHEASLVGCYRSGVAPNFRLPNQAIDNYDSNTASLSRGGWIYGVNQLLAYRETMSPRMVVEKWVEEKKHYNHSSNSCAPNHHCDSYTQVVWSKSLEVGCAMDNCGDGNVKAIFTICYYNPPGNFKGQTPY